MFHVSSLDWAGLIRDDGGKCHFQGLCTVHVRLQRRPPRVPNSSVVTRERSARARPVYEHRVGWLENLYVLESQSQILQITRTLRVRDRAYRCCTHCTVALASRSAIRSQSQGWRIDICSTCPQLCGHVRQRSVALHARACHWVEIAPFFSWRLALNAEWRSAA